MKNQKWKTSKGSRGRYRDMINLTVEEKGCITVDEIRAQLQELEGKEFIITIPCGDFSE